MCSTLSGKMMYKVEFRDENGKLMQSFVLFPGESVAFIPVPE